MIVFSFRPATHSPAHMQEDKKASFVAEIGLVKNGKMKKWIFSPPTCYHTIGFHVLYFAFLAEKTLFC
jgi:hypothetical protein